MRDWPNWRQAQEGVMVYMPAPSVSLRDTEQSLSRLSVDLMGLEDGVARVGDMLVPLNNMKSAKLVLTDKLIAATAPLDAEGADEVEEQEEGEQD